MTARPLAVTTVAHARAGLSGALRRFRAAPESAAPVILGSHRKAEAVLLPYERYEALTAADTGEAGRTAVERQSQRQAQLRPQPERASAAGAVPERAAPASPEQVERWLSALDEVLESAAEFVSRGRDAFRRDSALPLACEALDRRLGELTRKLVAADPVRFDDPMWSLAARARVIDTGHYNRINEQALWMVVSEGFPEIADLAEQQRTP